jgi:HSP20 family molecular chaperone IbpA
LQCPPPGPGFRQNPLETFSLKFDAVEAIYWVCNGKTTSGRFLVASNAIHLRNVPPKYGDFIERLFRSAFEYSPEAYRKDSLCGWGPWLYRPSTMANFPTDGGRDHQHSYGEDMEGVQIHETTDGIFLEIEVPHLKAESLYLEVSGNMLIVRGERLPDAEPRRRSNAAAPGAVNFERLVLLPIKARPGKIRAKLVGRVVRVKILKR